MSNITLVTHKIYRATEKDWGMGRTVFVRYIKTNYINGEPVFLGIDLSTRYTCTLFPTDWEFHELSPLEEELF